MTRLWLIRLGKYGEQEEHALATGELVIGWSLAGLAKARSREAILPLVAEAYPDEKQGTLSNWAIQLNQFRNVVAAGDLVIVPLKTTRQLAIGRVKGEYRQTADGNPARLIEWLQTDVPRETLKQDLLYSLGASQTICEIARNDAARRMEVVAKTRKDPGPSTEVTSGSTAKASPEEANAEAATVNLADIARDQIEQQIAARFVGHRFTILIAEILRAQGYRTEVSPEGPDRGIDIVAGQGALGFDGPQLVVQVKSGGIVTDQPTLQALIGSVSDAQAKHGLLVSWSGFTTPVRRRVNELYFRVRLWGRKEIVDALLSVYDQLPEDIRAELPLRRIWTLVPEEDPSS
jgi:restriction system protein